MSGLSSDNPMASISWYPLDGWLVGVRARLRTLTKRNLYLLFEIKAGDPSGERISRGNVLLN